MLTFAQAGYILKFQKWRTRSITNDQSSTARDFSARGIGQIVFVSLEKMVGGGIFLCCRNNTLPICVLRAAGSMCVWKLCRWSVNLGGQAVASTDFPRPENLKNQAVSDSGWGNKEKTDTPIERRRIIYWLSLDTRIHCDFFRFGKIPLFMMSNRESMYEIMPYHSWDHDQGFFSRQMGSDFTRESGKKSEKIHPRRKFRSSSFLSRVTWNQHTPY